MGVADFAGGSTWFCLTEPAILILVVCYQVHSSRLPTRRGTSGAEMVPTPPSHATAVQPFLAPFCLEAPASKYPGASILSAKV